MTARGTVLAMIGFAALLVACQGPSTAALWRFDPDFGITPDSTAIHLQVMETVCASGGSPEGRILPPIVTYDSNYVGIAIRILRRNGDQNCPSNPSYPYVVNLTQPVGARQVVNDGSPSSPEFPSPTRQ